MNFKDSTIRWNRKFETRGLFRRKICFRTLPSYQNPLNCNMGRTFCFWPVFRFFSFPPYWTPIGPQYLSDRTDIQCGSDNKKQVTICKSTSRLRKIICSQVFSKENCCNLQLPPALDAQRICVTMGWWTSRLNRQFAGAVQNRMFCGCRGGGEDTKP